MRLIIMGQQAFGKACLEEVIKRGEDEVVAVYCAPDIIAQLIELGPRCLGNNEG